MFALQQPSPPVLTLPQRALPIQEEDPRRSVPTEYSEYLSQLDSYVQCSLEELRKGQIKALDDEFATLDVQLDRLTALNEGWDGYDAPVPSPQAVNESRQILRQLQGELIKPQRISASAEGGIAFSFKASGERRAQIEVLNNGERFAHLYDLRGNSYTHEWPENYQSHPVSSLMEPILNYMQY